MKEELGVKSREEYLYKVQEDQTWDVRRENEDASSIRTCDMVALAIRSFGFAFGKVNVHQY